MKQLSIKALHFKSIALPFNLQRRDKIALAVAGAVLALFIIMQAIIFPIVDRRTRLGEQIKSQTAALFEIQSLKAEFEDLNRNKHFNAAQIKQRPPGFRLFSFLDALAGKSGIKQNIIYMKPSTSNLKNSPYTLSMVEMKLQTLTMEQLVTFLHGVETSRQMVWIKRMSISKGEKNQGLLNSVLQVETFQQ